MAPESGELLNAAELMLVHGAEIGIGDMQKRKMVNLILRVQDYFPVGPFLDPVPAQQPLLAEWVPMDLLNHPRHVLGQGFGGIGVKVDENEAFPYIGRDRF